MMEALATASPNVAPRPTDGRPPADGSATRRIPGSLIKRAKAGDQDALRDIVRQFVPADESLHMVEYLGFHGLLFGRHSLGCLTNKRVADVALGAFGEVVYQDAYLEACNSSVLVQPSRLALYVFVVAATVAGLAAGGVVGTMVGDLLGNGGIGFAAAMLVGIPLTLLLANVVVRVYYALRKCGLVVAVREGISVYVFTDRKRLGLARSLLKALSAARDLRLAEIGHVD